MRFAFINNERVSAEPKQKGSCPACLQPVTAKCGKQKIWHWAHFAKKNCDSWSEPETEWHRKWKNNFPQEWQEFIHRDTSGEKHIADVRTKHGLVIEFQHSPLNDQERASREHFYGNMLWVINGARLKRDYPRFRRGMERSRDIGNGYFLVHLPEECFPTAWLESKKLIFFDYQDVLSDPLDVIRERLWCLLPRRAGKYAVVVAASHKDFIEKASNLAQLLNGHEEAVSDIEKTLETLHRQNVERPLRLWSDAMPRQRARRL